MTNLDIYKIIHVNTLYPQASSQTCCCGCCHMHGKADPRRGQGLVGAEEGLSPGFVSSWLETAVGSAPRGYRGAHSCSVLATSGPLNYYHRNLLSTF